MIRVLQVLDGLGIGGAETMIMKMIIEDISEIWENKKPVIVIRKPDSPSKHVR